MAAMALRDTAHCGHSAANLGNNIKISAQHARATHTRCRGSSPVGPHAHHNKHTVAGIARTAALPQAIPYMHQSHDNKNTSQQSENIVARRRLGRLCQVCPLRLAQGDLPGCRNSVAQHTTRQQSQHSPAAASALLNTTGCMPLAKNSPLRCMFTMRNSYGTPGTTFVTEKWYLHT